MSKVMEMYVPKNGLLLFFLNFFKNKIFLYVANGPVQFVVCTRCSYYILCNKTILSIYSFTRSQAFLCGTFILKLKSLIFMYEQCSTCHFENYYHLPKSGICEPHCLSIPLSFQKFCQQQTLKAQEASVLFESL